MCCKGDLMGPWYVRLMMLFLLAITTAACLPAGLEWERVARENAQLR